MKRLKFNRVELVDFRCHDNLVFDFEPSGLYRILGSNGRGKTSIFEAVYWALTGRTLKGEPSKAVVRYGKKECFVILEFSIEGVEYIIKRSTKKLFLAIEGVESNSLHKKDVQEEIYQIVGMSHQLILNCFIFGQNLQRIAGADSSDKRTIFMEMFTSDWLTSMKEAAKTKVNLLEIELGSAEKELDITNNVLTDLRNKEYRLNGDESNFQSLKEGKIKTLKEGIERYNEFLATKAVKAEPIAPNEFLLKDKYSDQIKKLNSKILELQYKSQNLKRLIEKSSGDLLEELQESCNSCGRVFDDIGEAKKHLVEKKKGILKIKESLEAERLELKVIISNEQEDYAKFLGEHETYINKLLKHEADQRDYDRELKSVREYNSKLDSELQGFKDKISEWQVELKTLKDTEFDNSQLLQVESMITEEAEKIAPLEKEVKKLVGELEKYSWWLKTGLGANGLQAYVFSQLLSNLNTHIRKYCQYFNIDIQFRMDVEGSRKTFEIDILHKSEIKAYSSLSGGEKKQADMSIMFGIKSFLESSGVRFSILLLDEIMEGADSETLECLQTLLLKESEDTGIYFITHKSLEVEGIKNIEL